MKTIIFDIDDLDFELSATVNVGNVSARRKYPPCEEVRYIPEYKKGDIVSLRPANKKTPYEIVFEPFDLEISFQTIRARFYLSSSKIVVLGSDENIHTWRSINEKAEK